MSAKSVKSSKKTTTPKSKADPKQKEAVQPKVQPGSGPQGSDMTPPPAHTSHTGHPLQSLRQEIDNLFDSFLTGWPSKQFQRPHFSMPSIDVPGFDMEAWREPFREPFKRFEDTFGAITRMSPRADMKETDKAFVISAEMPGVAEGDIDVSVTDRRLTIKAEKKQEEEKDGDDLHFTERHYGVVQRTFTLPDTADVDKAKAKFTDGVLTVEVAKIPSAQGKAKKIPLSK